MQRLGKFLLTERLGRGGMAEVWKARITGPGGYARKTAMRSRPCTNSMARKYSPSTAPNS